MKKILFFCLFLASCAFSPLYSSNTGMSDLKIEVLPIPNQHGMMMRQTLKKYFSIQNTNPQYRLTVQAPTFSSYDKTITSKEFASTMQVSAKTTYTLTDTNNKKLLTDTVSAVSFYNVMSDPYATTVAENKMHEDLAEQLAQQIAIDVLTQLDPKKQ